MNYVTKWIPEAEFRKHIWDAGDRATLEGIDGYTRWVITNPDGTKYIARPVEAEQ